MDIKRMKKSELVELNGQLNESRIHCDAVIDALRAELAAARAEIEALRAQAESPVATGSAQAHSVSQRVVRNNKLIHEFDPEVQGSYLAAMRRARDLGGVVRRAQQ
jgi:predicted  nucleic acid-binding Zn-ribbon protein